MQGWFHAFVEVPTIGGLMGNIAFRYPPSQPLLHAQLHNHVTGKLGSTMKREKKTILLTSHSWEILVCVLLKHPRMATRRCASLTVLNLLPREGPPQKNGFI